MTEIQKLKQAVKLNPDHADAYYNLGLACINEGEYDKAIESFNQALELDPDHANAHDHLENAKNLKMLDLLRKI